MIQPGIWRVIFHDEFAVEFRTFAQDVQDELISAADVLQTLGPEADRPHVGTLNNPNHPNMKELRFKVNRGTEIWRAAFAFAPERAAIILAAAAKQGKDEIKFYKDLLGKANKRYDQHLQALKAANVDPPSAANKESNRRKN